MALFNRWIDKLEKRVELAIDATCEPKVFSFEWLLKMVSKLYLLVVKARIWLFEKGILKQKKLSCYVISVGNIVVGGAGKTPMAICLAQMLKKVGKKCVVVSRGYQGSYQSDTLIVSDGSQLFSNADQAGDEPHMMAKRKLFPVVVGKDRFLAGEHAIEAFKPDVVILDDGFQHLKLKRDLDLVLFDYLNPLGNGNCLPAGRLRESLFTAAKRADAVIFTRCPPRNMSEKKQNTHQAENGRSLEKIDRSFNHIPQFKTCHVPFVSTHIPREPSGLGFQLDIQNRFDIQNLRGKKAVLFSGIAKNASFGQTMAECGVNIIDHLEFKDHYRYKKFDFEQINKAARQSDADLILTTEKDWVKLTHENAFETDLVVVGVEIRFEAPQDFEAFLKGKMGYI